MNVKSAFSQKVFKIVGVAVIIAVTAVIIKNILFYTFLYRALNERKEEVTAEAELYLAKIGSHIRENEAVFNEFSEYQLSLLNEDTPSFKIEKDGDMQDMRDIVFEYFSEARAYIFYENNLIIRYSKTFDSFIVVVTYEENGLTSDITENEQYTIFNDHMYGCWIRTRY